MKKLKNKVFILITVILTLFLITILFIYNYENYNTLENNIKNSLHRMDQNVPIDRKNDISFNKDNLKKVPKVESNSNEPKMFMDTRVYTVLLDDYNNIKEVISHYEGGLSDDEIRKIASNILSESSLEDVYIGNLFVNKYSYSYNKNSFLVIIDNSETNGILFSNLKKSLVIFVLLESIIITISLLLTRWIIKPVEESFQKQKQFIADASHELKTPLAVIMASSEALESDRKEKKWLDNIKNESERMNKLVTSLLDLAKIENDVKREEYSVQDLSKIVEKSVLTFETFIFEENIDFNYDIDENIKLNCDPDNIKQLIAILLDNAIKHSYKDGSIQVNLKQEKSSILLQVKNKGDAIPLGEEKKIFERFYRVDKSRSRSENRYGLGLAIAKGIVENYGGKISACSSDGYTTFSVVFRK